MLVRSFDERVLKNGSCAEDDSIVCIGNDVTVDECNRIRPVKASNEVYLIRGEIELNEQSTIRRFE